MKLNIYIKSDYNIKMRLLIAGEEHIVYTNNAITIDVSESDEIEIKIIKDKNVKLSFAQYLMKLPLGIIRGLFDIIIMNIPENFVNRIELYSFCGTIKVNLKEQKKVVLLYQSSKYMESIDLIKKPLMKMKDQEVDLNYEFDDNAVEAAFAEYCIHFISISFYTFLIFFIILMFSFTRVTILTIVPLTVACFSVIVLKLRKEYKHMKKVNDDIMAIVK